MSQPDPEKGASVSESTQNPMRPGLDATLLEAYETVAKQILDEQHAALRARLRKHSKSATHRLKHFRENMTPEDVERTENWLSSLEDEFVLCDCYECRLAE